jgi:uncharacterized protein (DUF302 family)
MKAIEITIDLPIAEVETAVRAALKDQGFGVLTEIDVAATLKEKLDVERSPLKILGACNPGFAHRALQLDSSVSLLLPCNVVLEGVGDGTHVSIADPRELMPAESLHDLAEEAAAQLSAVIDSLGQD